MSIDYLLDYDVQNSSINMFKQFNDNDIDIAINKSGLKSLIENKGKDYLCGEGGVNLSGGEKQRIAIARAY